MNCLHFMDQRALVQSLPGQKWDWPKPHSPHNFPQRILSSKIIIHQQASHTATSHKQEYNRCENSFICLHSGWRRAAAAAAAAAAAVTVSSSFQLPRVFSRDRTEEGVTLFVRHHDSPGAVTAMWRRRQQKEIKGIKGINEWGLLLATFCRRQRC